MSDFSFIADATIDDAWFNRSLSRFAIVPDVQDPEAAAALVDELVQAYRTASERGDGETLTEVLEELFELHLQQVVLFPLGVQFEQSVLGKVNSNRFRQVLLEADPQLIRVRQDIIESEPFQKAKFLPSLVGDRSHELWRVFVTLKLATIGVTDIAEISQERMFALVDVSRVDGAWADWTGESQRRTLTRFTRYMASLLDDAMYGVSFLNPPRRTKVGPRLPSVLLTHPHLAWLDRAFEQFLEECLTKTKSHGRPALKLLTTFLATRPVDRTSADHVFSKAGLNELLAYAPTWSTPRSRNTAVAKLMEFAEWYCHDFATRQGEGQVELGWTRYQADLFRSALQLPPTRAEVAARPMPTHYVRILKSIIADDDFAWPKSVTNKFTKKPEHWFAWTDPETGKIEHVFCEVLPRLLLLLCCLPLRSVQARRLDSGEGDERVYDAASQTWRDAEGPHAGHWTATGAKNGLRGVFREIATDIGTIAGFWINSNKTQDQASLFDETSGYEIPWQNDEVLENLAAMRKWQEKYNPVACPLSYGDLSPHVFKEEPSRVVRAMLPDIFYLFRYPKTIGVRRGREMPPSYATLRQFFLDALDELERRLRAEDPHSAVRIITERDDSERPSAAIFTLHGLRSSTLTALHLAGVPIGILSKLVAGHATILMTLRYTKMDPAHVNEILNGARTKVLLEAREQFANFLKSASMTEAMRMTARLTDDGLGQAKGMFDEPGAWSRMDIGICPNGATLCHVGREVLKDKAAANDRRIYGRLPGGPRNCVRCRFLVTGLPFLIPLWVHAMAVLAKADSLSKEIDGIQAEADELKAERLSLDRDAPRSLIDRIAILNELFNSRTDARYEALADLHSTAFLIEKVRAIARDGDANDTALLPMLLGADGLPEIAARPSTRFELIDAVVQASRWFPSVASREFEAERDEFLNRVLHSNGYVPITLSALSPSERRRAADALAEMLLVEVGANEAQNLIEGRKTLTDLGLQEKLERAAAAAIGRPIQRLAPAAATTRIIEGRRGRG
ncbi:VPA1269 family protein [Bradyrhizobium sp. F1.13.3]|uniref:VPA1269 family protein n=1 Tax=Bradyrhizobium sp. F1.13.3 TaxID=3156351 RepID=UPI0033922DCD